jgi:hypothetical protein
MVAGVTLMAFPCFVSHICLMLGIALVVVGLMAWAVGACAADRLVP